MNEMCAKIQERLPELASDRIPVPERDSLEAHLAVCPECAAVLETLTVLAAAPPPVPGGLEARIQSAVRDEFAAERGSAGTDAGDARAPRKGRGRHGWFAPIWGLAAAATVALLLGRTIVEGPSESGPDLLALGDDEVALLLPDDGMVAGAPVLDGLSDDDLAQLLEEMER